MAAVSDMARLRPMGAWFSLILATGLLLFGCGGQSSPNPPNPVSSPRGNSGSQPSGPSEIQTTGTLSTRTRYLRTNTVTEYFQWLNTHWAIFNPPTSRFFVTDPESNQIFVFDPASETKIATIPVPGAFGIDDMPDHSTLYVGTLIGDVYSIDPVTMQVKQRYLASQIGPHGFQAWSALVLSDGRLALLGPQGGIPSVDGSTTIAIWNPIDNSATTYGVPFPGSNALPLCSMGNIGGFARTADRTGVLLGSVDSDRTLCELNPSTGAYSSAVSAASPEKIVTSPDGRFIALPLFAPNPQVLLFDQHTLMEVDAITVAGDTASSSNLVFSADSQTLFVSNSSVTSPGPPSVVYAYNVKTHQQIGWLPSIDVQPTSGGLNVGPAENPIYEVTDDTGLLAGPLEEGIGFLDTTRMQTGPVGSGFVNGYLFPATGPISGGTQVQWDSSTPPSVQSRIYFGNNGATLLLETGSLGNTVVITPPGNPGTVDVYNFVSNGGMQLRKHSATDRQYSRSRPIALGAVELALSMAMDSGLPWVHRLASLPI